MNLGGRTSLPQTHSNTRDGKRLVWYTETLWSKAAHLSPFEVDVDSFKELDADCWFGPEKAPTLKEVARHCQKINEASFEWPVILNDDGSLMDGGHRLCKALLAGKKTITAVQFSSMPEPDECCELSTDSRPTE